MPAFQASDLGDEYFVDVEWNTINQKRVRVWIRIKARPSKGVEAPEPNARHRCGFRVSTWEEARAYRETSPHGSRIVVDLAEELWEVSDSTAMHGWGPFLYDIAMELATANGAWLVSDREEVSPDAQKVWDYYLKNRPEVTKAPVPERQGGSYTIALSHKYQKPTTEIDKLNAAGQWEERGMAMDIFV